jgi:hypothetical protein
MRMWLPGGLGFRGAGRGRGWLLWFRVVAVVAAGALVTAGLVVAPARAASAAPAASAASAAGGATELAAAERAVSAASAGGAVSVPDLGKPASAVTVKGAASLAGAATPSTLTLPSLVVGTIDFPAYDEAEMEAVVNDWLPELDAEPADSPLTEILPSAWTSSDPLNAPSDWVPPNGDVIQTVAAVVSSDGTGSHIGLAVNPSPDNNSTDDDDAVLSLMTGTLAAMGALAVCGSDLFGVPSDDSGWASEFANAPAWAQRVCTAWTLTAWDMTATVMYSTLSTGAAPPSPFPWRTVLSNLLGATVGAFASAYVAPIIKAAQYVWTGLALWSTFTSDDPSSSVTLAGWLSSYLPEGALTTVGSIMSSFNSARQNQLSASVAGTARLFGFWSPATSGLVGNVPSGGPVTAGTGDCMDAYGSNGDNEPASPPAVPDQSVAINDCNGNAAQVFDFWPSGQIENWGLCMDVGPGPGGAVGDEVVNLQQCDGGYSQLWYENTTGEILNAQNGMCLDDPGGETTPGTQLVVTLCTGLADQLWAPPGGTAAVTAYGATLSVQQTTGSGTTLCLMPQTSLASPAGSNVITEPGPGGSNCNGPQVSWARGSNGTLMADSPNSDGFLCMDSDGPATTGPGGEAATSAVLNPCDGSVSQQWTVNSTTLGPGLANGPVNDGPCLNTPNGLLAAGVSMVVATCPSLPNPGELWLLPGVNSGAPSLSSAGDPCDIYASGGTPCTAAYSTTRAMYAGYDGPLYQVTRASDGMSQNIGLLAAGGDVNGLEQKSFCNDTFCTITAIYDQVPGTSPGPDTLTPAPGGEQDQNKDQAADAGADPVTIGGNLAYGVDIEGGMGYRDDSATGIPTGSAPEGMYMVASGTNVNNQCCFDFGNAETDNDDDGGGAMDAVNLSARCNPDFSCNEGSGPWVQADLENGLFQGAGTNDSDVSQTSDFVTAVLKNQGGPPGSAADNFELEAGNAQSGALSTMYNGPLPSPSNGNTWAPMNKKGAIVLGIGGDNSNAATGTFFEGVMTAGTPSDAADALVQANIVAAQYAGDSTGDGGVAQNADSGVVDNGVTYDFTVDANNGDLQATSLTAQGADWSTADLSLTETAGTPPVEPGTQPVAVVHDGVVSVFTVSAADDHLWETHETPGVTTWKADDLTLLGGTPPTKVTPSALFHDGYTTVYTVDAATGHLWTTYLKVLNGPWTSADLTAQTPGAPAVQPGTSPASVFYDGQAHVFTVGTSHDIWDTYLPTIDGTWSAQDITQASSPLGPQTTSTVTAGLDGGALDVFAAGDPLRHLWMLSLPSPGGTWSSQDLTAGGPQTPPVAPGTAPAALFHNGYLSAYTVDETSLDLETTYLSSPGGTWATENLSGDYQVPPTTETPVPLLHPGISGALDRVSVFTVNASNDDLQDSFLVAEGDPWSTQDMNTTPTTGGVPPVMIDYSPASTWSVASSGITYVFSLDPSTHDLIVTYLIGQGSSWLTENLTEADQAPTVDTDTMPTAVAWDGKVTVFSVGNAKGDLWETTLSGIGGTWAGMNLTAAGDPTTDVTPAAVFHGGQLDAYIVSDGHNGTVAGDLEQYYLPEGSATWSVQDLTTATSGPQVAPDSSPSALYHDGYTSVYVNAAGTDHLQNFFLTAIGNPWAVQDLTVMANGDTLAPGASPAAVYHSGYVTVFSADTAGDIWEDSLPAIGDSWSSEDLTTAPGVGVPPVVTKVLGLPAPSSLAADYHSGYVSVYSVDASGDLHTTFLPAIGGTWQTQDLTTMAPIPLTNSVVPPSALLHYGTNGGLTRNSVFTINDSGGTLQDTDLVQIGGNWSTQTLPN